MVRRSPSAQIAGQDLPCAEGLLTPPHPSNNASRLVPPTSSGCGWASAVSEDSLHSLHYLLTCTCKTARDARQFLFGAFFRSCTDRAAQVTLKTARDARQFLFWRFFRSCTDRVAQVTFKNSTGCSPIFISVFCPLFVPKCTFPKSNLTHLGPYVLRRRGGWLKKCAQPLNLHLKTAQDARKISVWCFCPLFVPKCIFPGSNLSHLGP